MERLSSLFPSPKFDGIEQMDIDDLLDRDIEVKEVKVLPGKFGTFVSVLFKDTKDGKDYFFMTGGTVLVKQLAFAKERNALPTLVKIVKEKNYYDIK